MFPTRKIRGQFGMGWRRQLPDRRCAAHLFRAVVSPKALPAAVDLRAHMPLVYEQGQVGSCSANLVAALVEHRRLQAGQAPVFTPSRLFQYWNTRFIEGTVASDAGATIADAIKAVATYGICPEVDWPYIGTAANPDTGTWAPTDRPAVKPPAALYAQALRFKAVSAVPVHQDLLSIKAQLAGGSPVGFGFSVYSSLYEADGATPKTDVPMPEAHDDLEGGHAVVLVGYDDASRRFLVRNSWGIDVQDGGHFRLPYEYVTAADLASDFWVIPSLSD